MFRSLFARLTTAPDRGAELFAAVVAEARRPHWYVEGEVPDTVDGRFLVLATVTALTLVRLDRGGETARVASVALTERYAEALDAELRQMGIGDPTLAKQMRSLIGALEARVGWWRDAVDAEGWAAAAERSLYRRRPPIAAALAHSAEQLASLWRNLERLDDGALAAGRFE